MTEQRIASIVLIMRKVKKFIEKNKKLIALVLAATFWLSIPQAAEMVWATSAEDKKEEAEENLSEVEDQIDDIQNQQQQVDKEIAAVRKKLNKLLKQQKTLEKEKKESNRLLQDESSL